MIVAVTGASASGKSEFAEKLLVDMGERNRIYVATMIAWDEECRERIRKHRKMREKKRFDTVECPTDLGRVKVPENAAVLLECLSNLAANEMYRKPEGAEKRILNGIMSLKKQARDMVIVTNEVFCEPAVYEEETEKYRELLGNLNQKLFRMADRVYLVEAGIPTELRSEAEIQKETDGQMKMILITGGAYQGKTELAFQITEGISGSSSADGWRDPFEAAFERPVILNIHGYLKRFSEMEEQEAKARTRDFIRRILKENPHACITIDEIGSGIVPVEHSDRVWRELAGEACKLLASEADIVYRVIGGLPQCLKGENI